MGKVAVVDTEADARRDRESFYDARVERRVAFSFGWPDTLRFVGHGEAVIYWSDKWGDKATYKHRREGADWDVYVAPGLKLGGSVSAGGLFKVIGPMPKHVAYIGKFRGLQFVTLDGHPVHMSLKSAHWAAARVPRTGDAILVAYDSSGVQVVVTGDGLSIERDGIVG